MADYKINHMTGRLYKFFTTSPSSYYDYQVNRVQDIIEDIAYSNTKSTFSAKCLSGGGTGLPANGGTKESEPASSNLWNILTFSKDSAEDSAFKDFAIKFRFVGDDEGKNQIPDPYLRPTSERMVLISLHNYAIADKNIGTLNEGDLIQVREEDGIYYVDKKMDGPSAQTPPSPDLKGAKNSFNNKKPKPLGEMVSQSILGKNQAKFYTPSDRVKNGEIEQIILHSTDGISGNSAAQRAIDRFADGPTLAFNWKNKKTGEIKINPSCEEVLEVDGQLPKGTLCHPSRKQVEEVAHTSIHYAVDQGGNIIQGVLDKDIAHHAGSKRNKISIGIEMTGRPNSNPKKGASEGYSGMYTETLLSATAILVADLCAKYNLKVDRKVIIGHDEFAGERRTDPGTKTGNFDWDDFLTRVKKAHGNIKTGK